MHPSHPQPSVFFLLAKAGAILPPQPETPTRASPGAVECSEHWANVSYNMLIMVFPGPKRWFFLESPQHNALASSPLYESLSDKS